MTLSTSTPLTSFHHFSFFFFTDPTTTEIYTLSLHDALPIWTHSASDTFHAAAGGAVDPYIEMLGGEFQTDRKSTRLNSSHVSISYAVFCLKKKKKIINKQPYLIQCRYQFYNKSLLIVHTSAT